MFRTDYTENGSGVSPEDPRYRHTSYYAYPKQYSDTDLPDLWFLEDFYKDPATIHSKILSKEFDEQLLNISGVKENYDCTNAEELEAAVSNDIGIKYFPSEERGEVVPTTKGLAQGSDYSVTCDPTDFDPQTGKATITIAGTGDYSGECRIPVRFNTAVATKVPVNKTDLTYTKEMQELIEPGTVENGTILYGYCLKSDEGELWRKGDPDTAPYPKDPNYADPQNVQISVKVIKGDNPMKLKAKTAKVRRSKLRKKSQTIKRASLITVSKPQGKLTYQLVFAKKGKKSFKKYFKINSRNGNVTVKKGLKKGKYLVKVKVKAAGNANYKPSSWKSVTSKVRVW